MSLCSTKFKTKETLLLDSTRPIGNPINTDPGRPKNTSAGVLSSWYALRATYSRELKVQAQLNAMGVRTFVPMMWKRVEKEGRAVKNLCFVYWTKHDIDEYIRGFGGNSPVNYYWDRTAGRALTVPEKAMDDFIKVASTMDEDIIYLTEISSKLHEGQTVKVKEGPFKGVEGKIVRIRKSRRILVELPGMLAVATTYVAAEDLEII